MFRLRRMHVWLAVHATLSAIKHFKLITAHIFALEQRTHRGSTDNQQWCCLADHGSPSVTQHVVSVEFSSLLLYSN